MYEHENNINVFPINEPYNFEENNEEPVSVESFSKVLKREHLELLFPNAIIDDTNKIFIKNPDTLTRIIKSHISTFVSKGEYGKFAQVVNDYLNITYDAKMLFTYKNNNMMNLYYYNVNDYSLHVARYMIYNITTLLPEGFKLSNVFEIIYNDNDDRAFDYCDFQYKLESDESTEVPMEETYTESENSLDEIMDELLKRKRELNILYDTMDVLHAEDDEYMKLLHENLREGYPTKSLLNCLMRK